MGVISVETRTVENIVPEDPANSDSTEQVFMEAGSIWFPNSAYKTAQAINDFNNGEQFPLMIVANWRGFSGGQRDMYNEVLKYGAQIVNALSNYKQLVFVYIIPNGELRGGAWVVVDPTINKDMMEMYADAESRGGVLEPEAAVEIKYRKSYLLATMERLDPLYASLKKQFTEGKNTKAQMQNREQELLPIYQQIALQFADLHDHAERMKAKGVIRKVLEWKYARSYFYWRVRRRLNEEDVIRKIKSVTEMKRDDIKCLVENWFKEDNTSVSFDDDDRLVSSWIDSHKKQLEERVELLRKNALERKVLDVGLHDSSAVASGIGALLEKLTPEERKRAKDNLLNLFC